MDKTAEIIAWLNQKDKDYNQGVELLELATSAATANRFRRGNPSFLLPHLVAFLRRIANTNTPPPAIQATPQIQSTPSIKSTPSKPAPLPQPIRRAKELLHSLWLRLVDFHNRLLALGFDNSDEKKKNASP